MQIWDAQFAARSPMFAPLRALAEATAGAQWPGPHALSRLASARGVRCGGGHALRFAALPMSGAADYELRIQDEGVVPLRAANWHDLFNALVWLAFPHTKAALNAAHAAELRGQHGGLSTVRSARRDALTLFDESGVLVISSSAAVLAGLRAFAWQRVFWQEREALMGSTRFVIFGHALYEKALSPYVGMSGHALLLHTPQACVTLDEPALLVQADVLAAAALRNGILSTRDLAPLPVLGVPGWYGANKDAGFYANTDYFRPGRTRVL